MDTVPSISVVIPAYNRSHCIQRAVDSVLSQRRPAFELVVVDDGSSDDLSGALAPQAARIRIIRHAENLGAAAARNTGIDEARGEFVAFLDSDDSWKPEKLQRQIEFMQHRGLDLCCTGFDLVEPGQIALQPAWRPYPEIMHVNQFVWGCYTCPGSTFIARRSLLRSCGGYDTRFARLEDWDLMLRLCEASPKGIGFLTESLSTIYVGPKPQTDNVLSSLDRMLQTHLKPLSDKDRRLSRNLRSAVAFHRASVYAVARNWTATTNELARCFFLAPRGNWPLRVILGAKVHSKLGLSFSTRHTV